MKNIKNHNKVFLKQRVVRKDLNMVESFMDKIIYLKKGKFYGVYNKKSKSYDIYLIGDKVEAISNMFACIINTDGTMGDKIETMYYRQNGNFKLLENNIPKIKSSYRRHLQHLMCNEYLYIKKDYELPNVDKYLDNPKEYVLKQPTYMIEIAEQLRTGEYYRNK